MSPGTAWRALPRIGPVSLQWAVIAVIFALAMAMVGCDAYLLHNIAILKQMYFAEKSQNCAGCTIPSWFPGNREQWGEFPSGPQEQPRHNFSYTRSATAKLTS